MKPFSRKLLFAAVAVALVAAVAVLVAVLRDWPVHHFGIVREGVLFRGGQPNAAALERIFVPYHIKTDVNLRGTSTDDWYRVEREFCQKRGVRMVDIPLAERAVVVSGLKEFLDIVTDPASQPVFVHCEAGSARTGYAVAAYRIAVQKWSFDKALAEAEHFRFKPDVNINPEYVKVLRELSAGANWRTLSDTPPQPQ